MENNRVHLGQFKQEGNFLKDFPGKLTRTSGCKVKGLGSYASGDRASTSWGTPGSYSRSITTFAWTDLESTWSKLRSWTSSTKLFCLGCRSLHKLVSGLTLHFPLMLPLSKVESLIDVYGRAQVLQPPAEILGEWALPSTLRVFLSMCKNSSNMYGVRQA